MDGTRREEIQVEDLVEALQRQRGSLEQLRYRFVALELLVEAREARYLDWASQDLARARRQAREADLTRAAIVGRLEIPGTPGAPSLREVAAVAPSPWAGILRDHHDSLGDLVAEIELHGHAIAQQGRDGLAELARTGEWTPRRPATPVGELVGRITGGSVLAPARSLAPGRPADLDPGSIECLLNEVIATGGRLRMPALLAFLR